MRFDIFSLKLLVLTLKRESESVRSEGYAETDLL